MKSILILFALTLAASCTPIQNINVCKPQKPGYMYVGYYNCPSSGKAASKSSYASCRAKGRKVLKQAKKEDRLWDAMNKGNRAIFYAKKRNKMYWRNYNRRK